MSDKTVLTTGDIGRICSVCPRTVSSWFDSGRLKGYRIPGSQDRRIPRANLVAFLASHNWPTIEQLTRSDQEILGEGLCRESSSDGDPTHVSERIA